MYPDDLKYTAEHEWVRTPGEADGSVRVGITHYAQDQLGDIVYVSLPAVGDSITAGAACGELESTKSVSDVYAPVDGEVVAVNESLDATPELVNSDPYGGGWLYELVPGRRRRRRRAHGRRGVPGDPRRVTASTARRVRGSALGARARTPREVAGSCLIGSQQPSTSAPR